MEIEQARLEYQQLLTTNNLGYDTRSPISDVVGFIVERKRSLFDIFRFVERGKYPLVWNESVKLRTIMATTVSCEQSFSVIKNTLHKNKKTATVFANVTAKYKQTKEVVVLEN